MVKKVLKKDTKKIAKKGIFKFARRAKPKVNKKISITFKSKKINSKNLGEILRHRRLEYNLDLDRISKELLISRNYLKALEQGEYFKLPGETYINNYLKNYCQYLSLDWIKIKKRYDKEKCLCVCKERGPVVGLAQIAKRDFLIFPKIFKNVVIASVVLLAFSYFIFTGYNLSQPPYLSVINPLDNAVINKNNILISGKTEAGVKLKINEQFVTSDKDGNFSQEINLTNGVNVIKVSAIKKYGKENVIYRKIMVSDNKLTKEDSSTNIR